jgi:hypothetical protein
MTKHLPTDRHEELTRRIELYDDQRKMDVDGGATKKDKKKKKVVTVTDN